MSRLPSLPLCSFAHASLSVHCVPPFLSCCSSSFFLFFSSSFFLFSVLFPRSSLAFSPSLLSVWPFTHSHTSVLLAPPSFFPPFPSTCRVLRANPLRDIVPPVPSSSAPSLLLSLPPPSLCAVHSLLHADGHCAHSLSLSLSLFLFFHSPLLGAEVTALCGCLHSFVGSLSSARC